MLINIFVQVIDIITQLWSLVFKSFYFLPLDLRREVGTASVLCSQKNKFVTMLKPENMYIMSYKCKQVSTMTPNVDQQIPEALALSTGVS